MTKFALYVPLVAKPGKEKEVADFLRSAVPLVRNDDSDNYVGDSVSCWEKLSKKLVSRFGGWR